MQLHDAQTLSCAPVKSPQPHVSQRKHSLDAVPHYSEGGCTPLCQHIHFAVQQHLRCQAPGLVLHTDVLPVATSDAAKLPAASFLVLWDLSKHSCGLSLLSMPDLHATHEQCIGHRPPCLSLCRTCPHRCTMHLTQPWLWQWAGGPAREWSPSQAAASTPAPGVNLSWRARTAASPA